MSPTMSASLQFLNVLNRLCRNQFYHYMMLRNQIHIKRSKLMRHMIISHKVFAWFITCAFVYNIFLNYLIFCRLYIDRPWSMCSYSNRIIFEKTIAGSDRWKFCLATSIDVPARWKRVGKWWCKYPYSNSKEFLITNIN